MNRPHEDPNCKCVACEAWANRRCEYAVCRSLPTFTPEMQAEVNNLVEEIQRGHRLLNPDGFEGAPGWVWRWPGPSGD